VNLGVLSLQGGKARLCDRPTGVLHGKTRLVKAMVMCD